MNLTLAIVILVFVLYVWFLWGTGPDDDAGPDDEE
jgi:hypothetical protein